MGNYFDGFDSRHCIKMARGLMIKMILIGLKSIKLDSHSNLFLYILNSNFFITISRYLNFERCEEERHEGADNVEKGIR